MRFLITVCACIALATTIHAQVITKIAFGSCAHQDKEQPIWDAIVEAEPEIWIWLGDNIYGDSPDPKVLRAAYKKQKKSLGYTALQSRCQIIGTWDDHDYGENNAGKEFAGKVDAQKALLDFLDEPSGSERRKQEGVYWSYRFGSGRYAMKILLLDVRYHRDSPDDPYGDIFGAEQRAWIEKELTDKEVSLTIIASGTQVIPEDHNYEKWAQFPDTRQWFFTQLGQHRNGGVIFLSGDRHIAEISRLELPDMEQPIWEITSSSLTHSWTDFSGEPNRHRVGKVFSQNNFGFLEIDWSKRIVKATLRDESGVVQREQEIEF